VSRKSVPKIEVKNEIGNEFRNKAGEPMISAAVMISAAGKSTARSAHGIGDWNNQAQRVRNGKGEDETEIEMLSDEENSTAVSRDSNGAASVS
jgi:hypothetical protein